MGDYAPLTATKAPPSYPVPEGKRRICVAGFKTSPFTARARSLAGKIAAKHGDRFETWFYFDEKPDYYNFLKVKFDPVPFPPHLKGHDSSPFVWIETGAGQITELVGGCEHFAAWARREFPNDADILADAPETCATCHVVCCTYWCHDGSPSSAKATASMIPPGGATRIA